MKSVSLDDWISRNQAEITCNYVFDNMTLENLMVKMEIGRYVPRLSASELKRRLVERGIFKNNSAVEASYINAETWELMRRKVIHDFKAEIQDLARRYGVNYITTNIREQVWRKVCMNIGCWSCLVIADGVLLNSRYLEKSSRRMNARNRCTTPPPLDLPRNRVLVFVPLPSDLPQLTGIEEPQLNIYFALSCYLLGMAQWKQHDFGDAMISFELCIRTREKLIRGNDWDPTLAAAMDKFGLVASRWNHPGVERYRARHERMHHAVER